MAITMTADEVTASYKEVMGHELGGIFHELRNQTISLYWNWSEYVELFGSTSARVDILNKAAGSFFFIVQNALWRDTLLHVCRLTDAAKTTGKANLSIRCLPDLVDLEKAPRTKELVQMAVDRSEFARDWRNRRLSHYDLQVALGRAAEPLAPASREHVREAITALGELVNYLSLQYRGSTTIFDLPESGGSAKSLLYVLREGIEAECARRNRIRSGVATNDDFIPRGAV
jgi:hypothetical protein